jgi:hypothetical protein
MLTILPVHCASPGATIPGLAHQNSGNARPGCNSRLANQLDVVPDSLRSNDHVLGFFEAADLA